MLALNTAIKDFILLDVITDKELSLLQFAENRPVVLAFICNHCPYVKHILSKLVAVGNEYTAKGFAFIAISSNDIVNYPDDSPDNMKILAAERRFKFPYCYDATQQVAKDYKAACTPDFYCFNQQQHLVYRGRFDASTPANGVAVTGEDLIATMDAVLQDAPVKSKQLPSMGCNIKWL
jgi:thiol-disulfide isomerase/thioredoxin